MIPVWKRSAWTRATTNTIDSTVHAAACRIWSVVDRLNSWHLEEREARESRCAPSQQSTPASVLLRRRPVAVQPLFVASCLRQRCATYRRLLRSVHRWPFLTEAISTTSRATCMRMLWVELRSVSAFAVNKSLDRSVARVSVPPASADRAIVTAIASCWRHKGIVFARKVTCLYDQCKPGQRPSAPKTRRCASGGEQLIRVKGDAARITAIARGSGRTNNAAAFRTGAHARPQPRSRRSE